MAAAEATAIDRGVSLWAVGGAPRDLMLGKTVNDLDLAVDADVARFLRALAARLPEAQPGPISAFGTASMTLLTLDGGARLDLARMRTEHYVKPGALPEVRWTRSIARDLARRDFTVNAIALGLTAGDRGRMVDPFEGVADAAARRLRVLHDRSFEDDATRLWRAARTAASCGLTPDAETAGLIEASAQWAATISGDRWSGELDFTARRGHMAGTVRLLDRWGVPRAIHPAWEVDTRTLRALTRHPEPMPAARFAALLLAPLPARDAILARLDGSREVREAVRDAVRILAVPHPATTEDLASLERAGEDARLAARWLAPHGTGTWRALERWGKTKPALTAADVIGLGVPQGEALGRILRELRRRRFERNLTSRAAERQAVLEFVEREGSR